MGPALPSSPSSSSSSSSSQQQSRSTTMRQQHLHHHPQSQTSPLLPTSLEILTLALYPTTLLLGSLTSLLSPQTRNLPPYDRATHTHPSATPGTTAYVPSYFAQKRNIFNVFFVKVGWVWISLAFFIGVVAALNTGAGAGSLSTAAGGFGGVGGAGTGGRSAAAKRAVTKRKIRQAIFRYALVTGWWIVVTQWFFGPALIDRGFRFTGGMCESAAAAQAASSANSNPVTGDEGVTPAQHAELAVTGAACKAIGGRWQGGHDLSGHVFMLVLGSAMLIFEAGWVLLKDRGWREERGIVGAGGALGEVRSADVEVEMDEAEGSKAGAPSAPADRSPSGSVSAPAPGRKMGEGWQFVFLCGVVGLSWWMILMTSVYFHTWVEKLTGLLVAYTAIFTVYFLPRAIPGLRMLIGLPGN
ncbi:MAG: hypothetical protein M4579_006030 [Chaenotheca gracillima]|nr:MAG: hypothetical protein M4579_006030 [Chaenotheca gracillima]